MVKGKQVFAYNDDYMKLVSVEVNGKVRTLCIVLKSFNSQLFKKR